MIVIFSLARLACRSNLPSQSMFGTAFLRRYGTMSSSWHCARQNCPLGNWWRRSRIKSYFVSESSVYRVLNAHDLITSPAFTRIKAGSEIKDKTMAINQLWQTDFTQLQSAWFGLVLPQRDPRRFQRLLHIMEALHKHTG